MIVAGLTRDQMREELARLEQDDAAPRRRRDWLAGAIEMAR